ncbi:cupredoxin domain-containing protein [Candidatus Nitrosocosmicus sp. T]
MMIQARSNTVTSGVPDATDSGQIFNSGFMPFGTFYQMTFKIPGDYFYYCTLHPYMSGTIHVGGAAEMGHHFTLTSGAELLPVDSIFNWTIVDWTINKTQNDRTLLNFRPISVAVDRSTPIVYNIMVENNTNNQTIFNYNFQVIGGSDLQVELISNSNMNSTNVYGPDVSDPNTGAYHVERDFGDGNYTIRAQVVSVGNNLVEDNIADEFGLRFVS